MRTRLYRFPHPIPKGVRIPPWAYLDPRVRIRCVLVQFVAHVCSLKPSGSFNILQAQSGRGPELTASRKNLIIIIVLSVILGVVVVANLFGLYFYRRKKRQASSLSDPHPPAPPRPMSNAGVQGPIVPPAPTVYVRHSSPFLTSTINLAFQTGRPTRFATATEHSPRPAVGAAYGTTTPLWSLSGVALRG